MQGQMGLLPLRFHNVGDLSSAGPDGILSRTVLENAVGSDDASIVAPGLAPAGRHSLGMGAWGATKGAIPAKPHRQQMAEWCAVTEGSVTTIDPTGKEHTFKAGDVFLVPKGISYVWKQSEDMKKFYVEVDHVVAAEAPTALIPFDRAQPCEGDEEFWFFCSVGWSFRELWCFDSSCSFAASQSGKPCLHGTAFGVAGTGIACTRICSACCGLARLL